MVLIDPRDPHDLATLLAVGGHTDAGLGYDEDQIMGRAKFAGKDFTFLPNWAFTVHDFVCGTRPFANGKLDYTMELPCLESPREYDTLLISGPRWYSQPGQNTRHNVYLYWQPPAQTGDKPVNRGLSLQVDAGAQSPWTTYMSRSRRGYMVNQVIVNGVMTTRLTVVLYTIRNKDVPCDTIFLRLQSVDVWHGEPLSGKLRDKVSAQLALDLFRQHCEPTDVGSQQPYWETPFEDLATACKAATSHLNWVKASDWIVTPWDLIGYCVAYAPQVGVHKDTYIQVVEGLMDKLWKHLPPERQETFDSLWPIVIHRLKRHHPPRAPRRKH
jgi:hypothetical protein